MAIDIQDAETNYGFEPVELLTPQKIFEPRWATARLARTMLRLRVEYTSQGTGDLARRSANLLMQGDPFHAQIAIRHRAVVALEQDRA